MFFATWTSGGWSGLNSQYRQNMENTIIPNSRPCFSLEHGPPMSTLNGFAPGFGFRHFGLNLPRSCYEKDSQWSACMQRAQSWEASALAMGGKGNWQTIWLVAGVVQHWEMHLQHIDASPLMFSRGHTVSLGKHTTQTQIQDWSNLPAWSFIFRTR